MTTAQMTKAHVGSKRPAHAGRVQRPATGPCATPRDVLKASPLYLILFISFVTLIVLRLAINNTLLDSVVHYTSEGGGVLEKVHPSLYGIWMIGIVLFTKYNIRFTVWERQIARAICLMGAVAIGLLVFVGLSGRAGSAGYLVDTYVGLTTCIVFLAFPLEWRRVVAYLLLAYLMASAALGVLEYVLRFRFLPYDEAEAVFRPTGLTNHPLELGQWCALALCMYTGLDVRPLSKIAMGALLLIACIASGARAATVATMLCFAAILVVQAGAHAPEPRRTRLRFAVVLSILVAGPLMIGLTMAAGLLDRFESGLIDANVMSRVDIYAVLGSLSWKEFVFGGNIEQVRKAIFDQFGYESIESSLLVFIVQFGIIGTIVLLAALFYLLKTMSHHSSFAVKLGLLSYVAIALTNNNLSAKSSSLFLIVLFCISLYRDTSSHRVDVKPRAVRSVKSMRVPQA